MQARDKRSREEAEEFLARGTELLTRQFFTESAEKLDNAILHLSKLEEITPEDCRALAHAHFILAQIHINHYNNRSFLNFANFEEYNKAEHHYKNAITFRYNIREKTTHDFRELAEYYNELGEHYVKGHLLPEAAEQFTSAISNNAEIIRGRIPQDDIDSRQYYQNLGDVSCSKGDWLVAVRCYDHVIGMSAGDANDQLFRNSAAAYHGAGAAYQKNGRFEDAFDDYTKQINRIRQINNKSLTDYANVHSAYAKMRDLFLKDSPEYALSNFAASIFWPGFIGNVTETDYARIMFAIKNSTNWHQKLVLSATLQLMEFVAESGVKPEFPYSTFKRRLQDADFLDEFRTDIAMVRSIEDEVLNPPLVRTKEKLEAEIEALRSRLEAFETYVAKVESLKPKLSPEVKTLMPLCPVPRSSNPMAINLLNEDQPGSRFSVPAPSPASRPNSASFASSRSPSPFHDDGATPSSPERYIEQSLFSSPSLTRRGKSYSPSARKGEQKLTDPAERREFSPQNKH